MAAVVRSIAPLVSLYVNDYNEPARAAGRRVGFTGTGRLMRVLFQAVLARGTTPESLLLVTGLTCGNAGTVHWFPGELRPAGRLGPPGGPVC